MRATSRFRATSPAFLPAFLLAILITPTAPAWSGSPLADRPPHGKVAHSGVPAGADESGDHEAAPTKIGQIAGRHDCAGLPGPMFSGFFRRLLAIDSERSSSDATRRIALFTAFNSMFTTRPLAEAALGRYWIETDEDMRRTYLELFHFHFMENYLGMAVQASRYWLDNMTTRSLTNGEALIALKAPGLDDHNFRALEVHVAPAPCGLALVDVRASGWSLAHLMRAEFQSIARKEGVDGLIDRLRDRARSSPVWETWQASR